VKLYFLVASADKVVDDMRGRSVPTSAAEPFGTTQTSNDGTWIMNAAIAERRESIRFVEIKMTMAFQEER